MPEIGLEHEHWWSKWYPYDRAHKYRQCQHPECNVIEKMKAMS